MLKDEMLKSLEEIKAILEESEFKKVTTKQKNVMREHFNKSVNFEYCPITATFLMSEDAFNSFEYYLGMEYEKDEIETKINLGENILVIYSRDCDKVRDLLSLIESENEE